MCCKSEAFTSLLLAVCRQSMHNIGFKTMIAYTAQQQKWSSIKQRLAHAFETHLFSNVDHFKHTQVNALFMPVRLIFQVRNTCGKSCVLWNKHSMTCQAPQRCEMHARDIELCAHIKNTKVVRKFSRVIECKLVFWI